MIEIRAYLPEDAEAVAELMGELGYPTPASDMRQRMAAIEGHPAYKTFVALLDGQVAGMIGIRLLYNYEYSEPTAQISTLVTKSACRGQGAGTALMHEAEQWAARQGSKLVSLTSGIKPERAVAHQFYEKAGYARNGYRFVKPLPGGPGHES